MASRYPSIKVVDYCFNPIHVVDEQKDIIVPCGKCDGCLLHKANEWSMRCGMEIEDTPYSIFYTLTYSNKYLPKLYPYISNKLENEFFLSWFSDHRDNVRFNGVSDVVRRDSVILHRSYPSIDITNWDNVKYPSIPYASKRDIQLYFKLLRKDLVDNGFKPDSNGGFFRYFIISEIGPSSNRPHYHGLIFCQSKEVADYLLSCGLYKSWQMCLPQRFFPYAHYCDSGASGYVTQYLTCVADLPRVFIENKEIRPFRLASKSPAIGFVGQDKQKIFQDVERGIIKYSRPLPRLESSSLLEYPSDYLSSLFPKCYQFNSLTDRRRFLVYDCLYREVRTTGQSPFVLRKRFSSCLHSMDFQATCACFRFCEDFVDSSEYYYYLLDMYYYSKAMSHLKSFYQSQQQCDFVSYPEKIFEYYPNIEVYALDVDGFNRYRLKSLESILSPLGYDVRDILFNEEFFVNIRNGIKYSRKDYMSEVSDITSSMVKLAKFNEMTGNSPSNV